MTLLDQDQSRFWAHLDEALSHEQAHLFQEQIERVLEGEPYQYVMGSADFYGRTFLVNPAVLIPRPETERLVEEVLQAIVPLLGQKSLHLVDVGTGSGAIAITLALELGTCEADPNASGPFQQLKGESGVYVSAVDISQPALEVARRNAEKWGAKVTFMHGDLLQPFIARGEQVDVIVSNPPYIATAEKDQVEERVLRHEPHLALFAGEDGLHYYREIVKQAKEVLNRPGLLAFEVGAYQAEAVRAIITQAYPQARCRTVRDFQGYQRVVLANID